MLIAYKLTKAHMKYDFVSKVPKVIPLFVLIVILNIENLVYQQKHGITTVVRPK